MQNIAPLGFNPSQHGKKPQKGNPLVKWLNEQEAGSRQRPQSAGAKPQPMRTMNNVPAWCRPGTAGSGSLKVVTESFYAQQVQPLVDGLLQKCFLAKPLHVVPFACAHFTGRSSVASTVRVAKTVTWPQYEERFIRPARLFLIQPLVHLLLQARPANVKSYVQRVFQVFITLSEVGLKGAFPAGQVPMERLAELLTSVLWSVTDEELKLLNGVLIAVSSSSNDSEEGVQLVEFAIRVPLEISERLCDALVNGPPKPAGVQEEDGADEGGSGDAKSEPVGEPDEQKPVPDDVLAFDSVDDRAEARAARVKEEMDDVMRAAKLATAFPRAVDEDCFDECPEANREATQLRELVGRLAEMAPERQDWIAEELPQLHADLNLLLALPPRTQLSDDSDDEDEDLRTETRVLRDIAERGAKICALVLAGLGPVIERHSAGSDVDEFLAAVRLQTVLPDRPLDDIRDEYPDIVREVQQLRALVDRLGEAAPERDDWCRLDAPKLRADIELFLAFPQGNSAEWEDFLEDFGAVNEVSKEVEQLKALVLEGARVLRMMDNRRSEVPQQARAAVAAAQLFESLPRPSLAWVEEENEQVLVTMTMLRQLVGQVADAQLDRPAWLQAELKPLVSALTLQSTMRSKDLEEQVLELEEESLTAEYGQLNQLLADAREALSALV